MPTPLSTVISLIQFPPGRRIFATRNVMNEARAMDLQAIAQQAEANIAFDQEVLATRAAYLEARSGSQSDPALVGLDNRCDRIIGALQRHAKDTLAVFGADTPRGAHAQALLGLFPMGVAHITRMPMIEQSAEMQRLVTALRGPLASHVEGLSANPEVDLLDSLATQYSQRLAAREAAESAVDFATFNDANVRGQRRLLQLVAAIAGHFHADSVAAGDARTRLLSPVLRQQEAIRDYYRRRRQVSDVDPDNGEEQPVPTSPLEVVPPVVP